ncbi:MAG: hypothetical protein O7G83_13505 [Proteobacteria bacterium]|nr:hypothetical protein [Pseudomonadota bacterium]
MCETLNHDRQSSSSERFAGRSRCWMLMLKTSREMEATMPVEEVTLEIGTPKGLFTGTFPKTAKIADVIAAVVDSLGLERGDTLELVHDGQTLQPVQRTLVSFGLSGTVQLELVATGDGV